MSETIPEDVMLEAHDAYMHARNLARGGLCKPGETVWHPIALAILQERDRCAVIAENFPAYGNRAIAKAIRGSSLADNRANAPTADSSPARSGPG